MDSWNRGKKTAKNADSILELRRQCEALKDVNKKNAILIQEMEQTIKRLEQPEKRDLTPDTRLTSNHEVELPNYDLFRKDMEEGVQGGTAIAVRKDIPYEPAPLNNMTEFTGLETLAVVIKLGYGRRLFCITINAHGKDMSITNDLTNIFKRLRLDRPDHEYILAGDFKANHVSWGSNSNNPRGTELYNFIERNKLVYGTRKLTCKYPPFNIALFKSDHREDLHGPYYINHLDYNTIGEPTLQMVNCTGQRWYSDDSMDAISAEKFNGLMRKIRSMSVVLSSQNKSDLLAMDKDYLTANELKVQINFLATILNSTVTKAVKGMKQDDVKEKEEVSSRIKRMETEKNQLVNHLNYLYQCGGGSEIGYTKKDIKRVNANLGRGRTEQEWVQRIDAEDAVLFPFSAEGIILVLREAHKFCVDDGRDIEESLEGREMNYLLHYVQEDGAGILPRMVTYTLEALQAMPTAFLKVLAISYNNASRLGWLK